MSRSPRQRPCLRFCAILLAGCGTKLDATQTSVDHYVEHVQHATQRIGDVRVTSTTQGDDVALTFTAPDSSWKDPRPERIAAGAPTALVAIGSCTISAKRVDRKSARVQASQCTIEGATLSIEGGNVWVADDVLYVELHGKLDGRSYGLTYPFGVVDEPLRITS